MSRFCPKCGKERTDRETYCSSCGAYLGDSQATAALDKANTNKNNVAMGTVIHAIYGLLKTIFYWVTQKLDKLYHKRYGKNYSTLSSDEKYTIFYNEIGQSTKYLYGMMLGTIVTFLLYGYTQEDFIIGIYCLAVIIFAFINLSCMLIYLYNIIRSKWSEIAVKLITGLVISFFLICLSAVFPPLAIILLGLTIYKNWQRRAFLDRYKRYTRILIKSFFILTASQIICAIFGGLAKIAALKLASLGSYNLGYMSEAKLLSIISSTIWRISIFEALGICAILAGLIVWNKCYLNFYKNEQLNGVHYDDCVKLTWLVPLTWLMLAFSYMTLIHSSAFNGDGLLADVDANMDTDINISSDMDTAISPESCITADNASDISNNMTAAADISHDSSSVSGQNPLSDTAGINNNIYENNTENIALDTSQNHSISAIEQAANTNDSMHSTIPDNNGDVNPKTTLGVYDETGNLEEKIVQTNEHTFAIQDAQGLSEGTAHLDSITGDMSLDDALGIHQGTITNDGIIKGVDELTDGRIITQYNGERIIQDSTNQTIGHILKNGIITDAQRMPLGSIKVC